MNEPSIFKQPLLVEVGQPRVVGGGGGGGSGGENSVGAAIRKHVTVWG